MVKTYLRAAIIAFVLFFGTMYFVNSLDQQRMNTLNEELREANYESEDSRLLLLYMDTMAEEGEVCGALQAQVAQHVDKNQRLLGKMGSYEEANLFGDEYFAIKQGYILNNIGLWMYFNDYSERCDTDDVDILYFYRDRAPCEECAVEEQVLNKVRDRCVNVRNFAFPVNVDVSVLDLVKERYGITDAPAIVIDGKVVMHGITTEDEILEHIECRQA